MFDQASMHRIRGPASSEALLALVSVFFHATGLAAIAAASWLTLTPLPLPPLKPYLVAPVVFSPAGAPAPLKGAGAAPRSEPSRSAAKEPSPDETLSQPADSAAPVSEPVDAQQAAEPLAETAGGGSPDGMEDGAAGGVPGGRCVGEDCDPQGPVGAGSGIPGSTGDAGQEILLPGIHDVTEPVIDETSRVLPRYPEAARRSGVEGQVILQAVIQADGSVGSVQVLRESPPRIGFGPAAAEAVLKWCYRPGTSRGRAVAVQMTITVQFTLTR
jgi:TonB family protein